MIYSKKIFCSQKFKWNTSLQRLTVITVTLVTRNRSYIFKCMTTLIVRSRMASLRCAKATFEISKYYYSRQNWVWTLFRKALKSNYLDRDLDHEKWKSVNCITLSIEIFFFFSLFVDLFSSKEKWLFFMYLIE